MKITEFSVKNYQFTLILFAALMAMGVGSLINMPRGEDPDFTAPQFAVVVVYPGTSPADMEKLVVDPIEKQANELDDIKRITSRIDDGLAIIRIDFKYESDPETKYQDVVREITALRSTLPQEILALNILKFSPSDVNILQIGLVSEVASYQELETASKRLKEDLEKIKSLKNIENFAFPQQQVRVSIDLMRLTANKVPLNNVFMAIQSENVNIPGGAIDMATKKLNVKTSGAYKSLEEMQNTVVKSTGLNIVRLKDIADVGFNYEEETYRARLNGKRAVWVTASRKIGTNIFDVEKAVQPVLENFKQTLPTHIQFEKSFDNAESVHTRLSHFGRDFAIAIFLVLITLIPLGWRAALVVMISIPTSLLIGLFLLDKAGFSINQLSIVGFVVALGLLVDDSIVVVENIERYLRKGYSRFDASIKATNQITLAVIGCTATLIFAFLPLLFLPEGSGDFIRGLPMAVVLTILASLFVSLTLVPFLSSQILSKHHSAEGNIFLRGLNWVISGSYRRLLNGAMRFPKTTLLLSALIFAGALLLVPKVGFSVFPASEKPMFLVNISMPLGTNLDETDRVARDVERTIARIPNLKNFATNVGKGNPRIYYNILQRNESANFAQIFVQLNKDVRPEEKINTIDSLRTILTAYPNSKITVKDFEQGPPVEAPIAIRIFGENLDTLRNLSFVVEAILQETAGTIYISNELTTQTKELKVVIDHEKAGTLGVPIADIDRTIRMAITGLPVGKFSVENATDDYTINVTLPRGNKQNLDVFDKIYINSVTGASIPLKQLAQIAFQTSPNGINHFDKDRYTTVTSFLKTGYNTTEVTAGLLKKLDAVAFPKGYGYKAAGEVEAKQESFGGLGTIILITVFGLLGILILEFKTFKSTIVVLSVIPLGIIGAIIALLATGYTFSFVAIIGVIALAGIEVKNSILLVDYTEQLRAEGVSLEDAIQEAGETRFVPIILTTLTAIGGLIPLAIEFNPLYSPLAWVLIGGLISSTILTRIVTPVLYKLLAPKVTVTGNAAV
jgi:multidrug efflux pump subunit AcrB